MIVRRRIITEADEGMKMMVPSAQLVVNRIAVTVVLEVQCLRVSDGIDRLRAGGETTIDG